MKRIAIIGCCGAGKSTLAKELHQRTNLPLVHLDKVFWNAGWQPSDRNEFQTHMREVYSRDAWIIDGHYYSTMDERLARADTVFHLDYPTLLCLRRTLGRIIRGLGRDRSDCAEGCPEQFDWEFFFYVLNFRKTFRARTQDLLEKHPHLTVHTFTHPKQLTKHFTQNTINRPPIADAP